MTWDNFFIAQASSAAALTGLIFVGVSINLSRIIAVAHLPSRALQSLILLINILILSSLMLIPKQSLTVIGVEVLTLALILMTVILKLGISIMRTTPTDYKQHSRVSFFLTQIAVLPFLISGICILYSGECGIYFLVPGIIFSFLKAIEDAWVLLVEINR